MYHVLVYRALKRAEHSSQEDDGILWGRNVSGTSFPEGSWVCIFIEYRIIRCSFKDVITVPTREKIPTGNKELDHFAEFWCGKELGRSRYRIYGRFNEAYNVERRQGIYLSIEMEPAKFTQVSRALSVVERSEPTFPCWVLAFPSYLSSWATLDRESMWLSPSQW